MTKFRELLPIFKQTYYLPFIWAFTWYSYWLFRDITFWHRINIINFSGTIISTGVIVSAVPIQNAARKTLHFVASQTNKSIHWALTFLGSQTRKKIQIRATTSSTRNQTPHSIQIEKPLPQPTRLNRQKQKPEQRPQKSQQPLPNTNGCPKNIDYFTQKPRPKQTPEECITCKNLITCVCQTSD